MRKYSGLKRSAGSISEKRKHTPRAPEAANSVAVEIGHASNCGVVIPVPVVYARARFGAKKPNKETTAEEHYYLAKEVAHASQAFKESYQNYQAAKQKAETSLTVEYFTAIERLLKQAKAYQKSAKLDMADYDANRINMQLLSELKAAVKNYKIIYDQHGILKARLQHIGRLLASQTRKLTTIEQAQKSYKDENNTTMKDVVRPLEKKSFALNDALNACSDKYTAKFEALRGALQQKGLPWSEMHYRNFQNAEAMLEQQFKKEYGEIESLYLAALDELDACPEYIVLVQKLDITDNIKALKAERVQLTKAIHKLLEENSECIGSTKTLLQSWRKGSSTEGQALFDVMMKKFVAHIESKAEWDKLFNNDESSVLAM